MDFIKEIVSHKIIHVYGNDYALIKVTVLWDENLLEQVDSTEETVLQGAIVECMLHRDTKEEAWAE